MAPAVVAVVVENKMVTFMPVLVAAVGVVMAVPAGL